MPELESATPAAPAAPAAATPPPAEGLEALLKAEDDRELHLKLKGSELARLKGAARTLHETGLSPEQLREQLAWARWAQEQVAANQKAAAAPKAGAPLSPEDEAQRQAAIKALHELQPGLVHLQALLDAEKERVTQMGHAEKVFLQDRGEDAHDLVGELLDRDKIELSSGARNDLERLLLDRILSDAGLRARFTGHAGRWWKVVEHQFEAWKQDNGVVGRTGQRRLQAEIEAQKRAEGACLLG